VSLVEGCSETCVLTELCKGDEIEGVVSISETAVSSYAAGSSTNVTSVVWDK